jgi:hypothetical protein
VAGKSKNWTETTVTNGIGEIRLSSWEYFSDFIAKEMASYKEYIYRGQRCRKWKLEPTLDRMLRKKTTKNFDRNSHLENFKLASRGRRGNNPPNLDENDWWALGQHHGLATPVLDWTESPFVAAYFAFLNEGSKSSKEDRIVWAICKGSIKDKSLDLKLDYEKDIKKEFKDDPIAEANAKAKRAPIVELFSPPSNENPRLVNQRGLFTRAPDEVDLETWVKENFEGVSGHYILIKIVFPNEGRKDFLQYLNRMNINHLTLFPDLTGASTFCNFDLSIENY